MPNDYSPSAPRGTLAKFLMIGIMAVLVGGAIFYFFKSKNQTADGKAEEPQATVRVQTEVLEKKTIADTVQAFGMLQPDLGAADTISLPMLVQIKRLLVNNGQFVQSGQSLFEISIDPAAEAAYQQAVTAEKLARDELSRTQTMLEQQLATNSQVATARKALQDAEALLQAQHRMQTGLSGNIYRAPHAGLVASLTAQQGDRIQPGISILQLSQTTKLVAQLGLTPEAAQRVKPGMPVQVSSLFDETLTADGTVAQVMGVIDPKTRMVDVIAHLKSIPASLLPGTQIQARVSLSSSAQWVVARSAVLNDEKGAYLFQVDHDHARRVEVKTGLESGDLIAISPVGKEPLDANKKIVVSGNYELKDGMALKETASEAKQETKDEVKSDTKPEGKE